MSEFQDHQVRILHFEDDAFDAELIARELRNLRFEHSIKRVATQEEFEDALGSEPFDVVISDSGIPGSSVDVLSLARAKQPSAPVVFLSGSEFPKVREEALRRGAAAFLSKNRLPDLTITISSLVEKAGE
jgi:DNA-binding NarL/FixJ family response regulator